MLTKLTALYVSIMMALSAIFGLGFKAPEKDAAEIKNVIILIGDGMGYNHLYATEKQHSVKLDMLERSPYKGFSKTQSASGYVTDSAAGGTALSTGIRTMNGYVSVYPGDPLCVFAYPATITEIAMKYGKSAGIVTSDSITGATPATYSAHVKDRGLNGDIFRQQINSDIDIIWGAASDTVTKSEVEKSGYVYCSTLSDVESLQSGQKSIGQFDVDTLWSGNDNGDNPTLSELAGEALDILSEDPDGFFLMLEGAHIDKFSHKQDAERTMASVLEFDRAISKIFDYADENKNTLVIITADHETGSVTLQKDGSYKWKTNSHSGVKVPVLVYGSDSFMKQGETMKNTEIPRRAVAFMTNNKEFFPVPYSYAFAEK